jgi:protein-tyrosine phosphatase
MDMEQAIISSVSERRLLLTGAVNFRDVGGHVTAEHQRMRRGLVYRSDHLSRLSAEDQRVLLSLNFQVVCDFRSIREQQRAPDLLPPDGSIRYHFLPVEDRDFDPATAMERVKAGDHAWMSMDFVIELYRRYLDNFGYVWGKVLTMASFRHNLPLVFHCTGGKDRTGICAALLLMVLGVEEESILLDHQLSTACNAERVQPMFARLKTLGIEPEQANPYLNAPVDPLAAVIEHLKNTYGTVEDYLLIKGGLEQKTLTALRELLLQ